jgi:16S rRNA (adenine1518-N6/adenine1519-N6)-dimethyltransferase
LGVLTERLLAEAGRVVAFEYDPDMQKIITEDFPSAELVGGDVLRTGPAVLSGLGAYSVVANIPYQITTPLIRLFLETEGVPHPEKLTLLVQKEVGKRLAAREATSDRGYLSVLVQYLADVTYVATVPAKSFLPPPKVDSGILHMKVRTVRELPATEERVFLRFVHALFITPRKQLKNVLAGIKGITNAEASAYLTGMGLSETVRAQEISVAQWISLYKTPIS